jgi:hypothetical protein
MSPSDEGSEIFLSQRHPRNVAGSTSKNCNPFSNTTEWSRQQQQNAWQSIAFTDAGILIISKEHERIQIERFLPAWNYFEIPLKQVTHIQKNSQYWHLCGISTV